MSETDDLALLRQYVELDSDVAFETLLNRHVNLVYSTAMRQVRDPSLASEVTQTTFIILAKKAATFDDGTILSGWLYRTVQYAAARALRTEARRREREKEAAQMQTEPTESIWEQLSPILDQAMAGLSAADRNAVVLRYFENKSSKDVGAALGINESAAQKRVARAVEKLRDLCGRRGVAITVAALATVISANAVQAAPLTEITTTAGAVKATAAAGSTGALVKATLKLLTWQKYKIACYATAGLLTAGAAGTAIEIASGSGPRASGWALSSWMTQLDDGQREAVPVKMSWELWDALAHRTPGQRRAAEAIQTMGTNALPYLLVALKDSGGKKGYFAGPKPEEIHREAALSLDALGPMAEPAIPQLKELLHGDLCPKEAATALAAIGPAGWQVLIEAVGDTNGAASICSVWALGSHRVKTPEAAQALERAFFKNEDESQGPILGWALVEIGEEREKLVPALVHRLRSQREDWRWGSAVALGEMGANAQLAVPALVALLKDINPKVQHDAAQALEQIDPRAAAEAGATGALLTRHIPNSGPQ